MARPFQDQFLPRHDSSDSTRDGWHASTEGMMHYLERTRRLMDENVRDCLVTGHQALIDGLILPDANDRHVLAAAIQGNADVIVTFNLRHFPEEALAPYQIEAIHPDDFLLCQIDLSISIVCGAAKRHRSQLKNPPKSVDEYLASLERQGLPQVVAQLRQCAELI